MHVLIWLDASRIEMLPGANLGEKGLRGGSEGAGAIGVAGWGELPCSCWGEILGFDEGKFEMRGLFRGACM